MIKEWKKAASQENFLCLSERVHKLIHEKEKRRGWYGEAFSTALVGLSLLDQRDKNRWRSALSDIERELKEWLSKGDFDSEYEIVGLAFAASFFKRRKRKSNFKLAKKRFIERFEGEVERWKAFKKSGTEPRFHLSKDPFYLYALIFGLRSCDYLDSYADFLRGILDEQEKAHSGISFIKTAKMILADYSKESCERGLQKMIEVEPGGLRGSDVVPTFWFITKTINKIRKVLPEETEKIKVAEKKAGTLYKLLFQVIQTSKKYEPSVVDLALLNSVFGGYSAPLLVIPEEEFEERVNKKSKKKTSKILGLIGVGGVIGFLFLIITSFLSESNFLIKVLTGAGSLFFLEMGIICLFGWKGIEIRSRETIITLILSPIPAILLRILF